MTAEAPWPVPAHFPVLPDDEVHVWYAALDAPALDVPVLESILSADERERADRYRGARDRRRSVTARGLLRLLLSRYLDLDPASLRFDHGRQGKPSLSAAHGGAPLCFNVSHSGGAALYAVTRGREVGIDLERIRHALDVMSVAARFFSPREVAVLRGLPDHTRRDAFFRCWTRKEAYIKARGEGLALRLDSFDVALAPAEPAALLHSDEGAAEVAHWTMRDVSPAPGYAAALVVQGYGWRLCRWRWPSEGIPGRLI